jgi:superfamily II DNA or RNA helicase
VARGERVLVLVHRVELLEQASRALQLHDVAHGVIAAGSPPSDQPVQVAMVATIARRLEAWRGWADLVIVDEAHHAVAGSWARVLASQPRARLLGVTATPERLDGRGLAECFDELIVGPQPRVLQDGGYLVRARVFEPGLAPNLAGAKIKAGDYIVSDLRERGAIVSPESVVADWIRLADAAPALNFSPDIPHSHATIAAALAAGRRAAHLDGETSAADRREAIRALGAGELDLVSNVGLFAEGVDLPNVGVLLMSRPTASLGLYLQMVGRVLRPAPGKAHAVILDFVGNCGRHGLPDRDREWSLDSKSRKQRETSESSGLRRCTACSALNAPQAFDCAECGADLRTPRERHEVEIRLAEARRREAIQKLNARPYWWRLKWAGSDERRLRLLAEMHGYASGWVWHQRQRALGGEERQ